MLRCTAADEQRGWCKAIRRAMAAFSTSQLREMKAAGVRFWKWKSFRRRSRTILCPKARGPLSWRAMTHLLGSSLRVRRRSSMTSATNSRMPGYDVRGRKLPRLDKLRGRGLDKAVKATPSSFSSESATKRLTIKETVGGAPKKYRYRSSRCSSDFCSGRHARARHCPSRIHERIPRSWTEQRQGVLCRRIQRVPR